MLRCPKKYFGAKMNGAPPHSLWHHVRSLDKLRQTSVTCNGRNGHIGRGGRTGPVPATGWCREGTGGERKRRGTFVSEIIFTNAPPRNSRSSLSRA